MEANFLHKLCFVNLKFCLNYTSRLYTRSQDVLGGGDVSSGRNALNLGEVTGIRYQHHQDILFSRVGQLVFWPPIVHVFESRILPQGLNGGSQLRGESVNEGRLKLCD